MSTGESISMHYDSKNIAIAGCGGLGSNCGICLTRMGHSSFTIIDFVEEKNLDRQYYFLNQVGDLKVNALSKNMLSVNSNISIKEVNRKITIDNIDEILSECEVIIECFDAAANKLLLAEYALSKGKYLVSASGICGLFIENEVKLHKYNERFVIIGDMCTDINLGNIPKASKVSIVAALQAEIALQMISMIN